VKGIDTNVLARYLVQDDLEQAMKATRFIARECTVDEPGVVNKVVLCELVWVLESAYRDPRAKVALVLASILRTTQLRVEDPQEAHGALEQYRAGTDFADALIAIVNRRLGVEQTVTFDREAGRREGFLVL
jgi:predicted nucleic-acid-binding protein